MAKDESEELGVVSHKNKVINALCPCCMKFKRQVKSCFFFYARYAQKNVR